MRLALSQTLRSAAVLLLGCLAGSIASAQINPNQHNNPGPPPPPTQNVLVVNSSGQPVPTAPQGTTNVAGTVNVGNTPNVTITNTPSVNVANSPTVSLESGASVGVTSPLDGQGNPTPIAVLDAFQIYEDTCMISFSGAQFGSCDFQSIPSDKQLVIQEFDAYGLIEAGLQPTYVALYRHGAQVAHYFPATQTSTLGNLTTFVTNGGTRVYIPPSVTPMCGSDLTGSSNGLYLCQLSGYLVDAPLNSPPGAAPAQGRQLPPAPFRNSGAGRH